ncbi:hypothetical protein HKX48_003352, partial [Thoreauomyces humboldtii]
NVTVVCYGLPDAAAAVAVLGGHAVLVLPPDSSSSRFEKFLADTTRTAVFGKFPVELKKRILAAPKDLASGEAAMEERLAAPSKKRLKGTKAAATEADFATIFDTTVTASSQQEDDQQEDDQHEDDQHEDDQHEDDHQGDEPHGDDPHGDDPHGDDDRGDDHWVSPSGLSGSETPEGGLGNLSQRDSDLGALSPPFADVPHPFSTIEIMSNFRPPPPLAEINKRTSSRVKKPTRFGADYIS